jgi:hypothetical protein
MRRTTIRLDDQLLKDAKATAAASGRTFTELVETALRETIARPKKGPSRERVTLPTFKGALMPGVDLDDSAGLLNLMEQPDDPS